jgi:hypothetical protein
MELDLTNYEDRWKFESEIDDLIKRSELSLAERCVTDTIEQAASTSLKSVSNIPKDSVTIEGWDNLCSDLVKADAMLRAETGSGAIFADLVIRNDPSSPRLELHRCFYGAFEQLDNGIVRSSGDFPRIGVGRPVCVTGLESLMAVQRTPLPNDSSGGDYIVPLLAGHLLVVKLHRAFDDCLKTVGLPLPINILLETCRSRPENDDFGPGSRRFIEATAAKLMTPQAADQLLAERRAEDARDHQARINKMIAEYRELYRLVRLYPFYRFIGRNKLGGMLTQLLQFGCEALRKPSKGVGWRMNQTEFEGLLRAIVVFQEPPSVEDALDVRHVNALHVKWLEVAREHEFAIAEMENTLFDLLMRHSLRFGGVIVRERWASAGDYILEAK